MNHALHFYPVIKYNCLLFLWLLPFGSQGHLSQAERIEEIPFRCAVYAIEKDENGMMWVGTACGLRIFNGYAYQKLEHELDAIPVVCLLADTADNVIWVGTQQGLYAVDHGSGDIMKEYPKKGTVRGLFRNKNGILRVAYADGSLLSIPPDGRPTTVFIPELADIKTHPFVQLTMIEDERGLFFFNNERLYLRTTGGEVLQIRLENGMESAIPVYLKRHEDIIILCALNKGALLLDRKTLRDITPQWMDRLNQVYGVAYAHCFLRGDLLYIYYPSASIWVLDLKTGEYSKVWEDTYHLASRELYNPFFVDQNGTLWIGLRLGMLKIPDNRVWFECLLADFPGLPLKPSMRHMIEDGSGDLYLGSYMGLFHYNRQTAAWQVFSSFGVSMAKETERAIPCGLLNEVNSDYLYLVSEREPFYRFNKKKKVFETDFFKLIADSSFSVRLHGYCLLKDKNGKIWIGSDKGLISYDPQTQELRPENSAGFAIGNFSITYMKQSQDEDIIWLCTSGGLFKLDITKGITGKFDTHSQPAISANELYFVDEDKNGNLWVGTNGGGMDIIDQALTNVRNINTSNSSLSNDVVYGQLWENEHTAWVSTQRGLSRYDISKDMFSNYYVEHGMCHNEFNRNSLLKDRNGRMYFGGVSGVTAFDPHTAPEPLAPINLFISRVSAWDGRHRKEKIYRSAPSGKIIMEPHERSLVFFLGLSDYTRPNEHRYYYRIIGLHNDEWTSLGNQHILRLESLPYGNWMIEMKAVNARGIPADNIPGYTVIVKRPYYKTEWFFTLLSVAGAALIYGLFWIRFQHFKKLTEQKIQVASDLHDEIGGMVTGIVMHASLLNKMDLTEEEKQVKVSTIIDAGRSLSVSIRDVLWSIDARNDTAGKLAGYMLERIQNVLNRSGITLRFYASDVDENLKISTSTRQHVYRIFKEAVNNALKHSNATCITVTYSHRTTGFCLVVENDGVSPSNETTKTYSGQGLKNIEMRAKKLKAVAKFIRLPDKFKVIVASSNKFHQLTD